MSVLPDGGYGKPPYIVEHRPHSVGQVSMILVKNGAYGNASYNMVGMRETQTQYV